MTDEPVRRFGCEEDEQQQRNLKWSDMVESKYGTRLTGKIHCKAKGNLQAHSSERWFKLYMMADAITPPMVQHICMVAVQTPLNGMGTISLAYAGALATNIPLQA